MEKKDITSRDDLVKLLNAFYEKALHDEVIGHFFTTVIHLDLLHHIPVIADFWETVLLNGNSYKNNTMKIHMAINQLSPMEEKHFKRWLDIFNKTVNSLFEGEIAERAKQRALSIATVMQINIIQSSEINFLKK